MNRKAAYNLRKKHRSLKRIWLLFVGLIVVILFFAILQLKNSKFLGNDWRTNIVFHSEPTVMMSFAKQSNDRNIVFIVPGNLVVIVPNGYQKYQLQAVWKLADLEKKTEIYTNTIEDLFSTYLSGWIGKDDVLTIDPKSDNVIKKLAANFNLMNLLLTPNISNLSIMDRFLLWWKLIGLQNNFDLVDLSLNSRLVDDLILPDATAAKSLNNINWLNLLNEKLVDTQIHTDGLSLEIRNSTQISGIGQRFSQILTNSGAKVITLNNTTENIDKCEIIYNPKLAKFKIIRWLNQEFSCKENLINDIGGPDIVVVLGKFYGDRWSQIN